MPENYRDEIIAFIKAHGGENVRLVHGGKHDKLLFDHNGQRRWTTVAKTPGDFRAKQNQLSDLKRLLGPPLPPPEEKPKRRLDDMMNDITPRILPAPPEIHPPVIASPPEAKAKDTFPVNVSCYRNGPYSQVRFVMGASIRDRFPSGYDVKQVDDETWYVKFGLNGTGKWFDDNGKGKVRVSKASDILPFAAVNVEAVIVDDGFLVSVPQSMRRLPIGHAAASEQPQPPQTRPVALTDGTIESRLLAVLREIKHLHQLSPYILNRTAEGEWIWQAPTIKL